LIVALLARFSFSLWFGFGNGKGVPPVNKITIFLFLSASMGVMAAYVE
jgi:hypothetical protein